MPFQKAPRQKALVSRLVRARQLCTGILKTTSFPNSGSRLSCNFIPNFFSINANGDSGAASDVGSIAKSRPITGRIGLVSAAYTCCTSKDIVTKSSVSAGRIDGDSGTSNGPDTNAGKKGMAAGFSVWEVTSSARTSNELASRLPAIPIASGHLVSPKPPKNAPISCPTWRSTSDLEVGSGTGPAVSTAVDDPTVWLFRRRRFLFTRSFFWCRLRGLRSFFSLFLRSLLFNLSTFFFLLLDCLDVDESED